MSSTNLATIGDKLSWAAELAKSGMLPAQYRANPANLLWAIEMGQSLGLSPMQAITGIHVIEGRPTASAALIGSLARGAGHRLRVQGDDTHAIAQIWRKDDPEFCFESVWTLERAKVAGLLGKGVWRTYPAAMLQARAITEVARQACPEALSGVQYTAEELDDGRGATTQATFVQSSPVQQSKVAERIARLASPAPAQAPQEALPAPSPVVYAAPVVEAPAAPPVGWLDDDDRKAFCAELSRGGCDYNNVARWSESLGRPRPSAMTWAQRNTLVEYLHTDNGMARYRAFLLACVPPPAVAVPASNSDDVGFHGEAIPPQEVL